MSQAISSVRRHPVCRQITRQLLRSCRVNGHDAKTLRLALWTAAVGHNSDWYRLQVPLYLHVLLIAYGVQWRGGNTEDVISAVLHHMGNNRAYSIPDLKQMFGETVVTRVVNMTKNVDPLKGYFYGSPLPCGFIDCMDRQPNRSRARFRELL